MKLSHISIQRPVLAVVIVLTMIVAYSCGRSGQTGKELVVFYDVPLVCGAAPDIGCGSRAKPVFIEMEQHTNIKEAWLNRAGTVIAVVAGHSMPDWKQIAEAVEPIFKKYDVPATYVEDRKRQDELMPDFRAEGKWYKGVDVDKLSIEEAGRLAEKAVKFAMEAKLISEPEAEAIRTDVETDMKAELVKVRTCAELEASGEQWYADVYGIYQKHIGKERADTVRKFYEEYQSGEHEE